MSESDGERGEGFSEGLESSEGDPRVALLLNLVLSALFGWTIIWASSFVGIAELTLPNIAILALILFAITQFVVQP